MTTMIYFSSDGAPGITWTPEQLADAGIYVRLDGTMGTVAG